MSSARLKTIQKKSKYIKKKAYYKNALKKLNENKIQKKNVNN